MKLLDVASPILLVDPSFFIVFSILIVFLEAAVLKYVVKYHTYRTAFLDSLLANIVSTLIGFLLLNWIDDSYMKLLALWALTVIIESGMLMLVNKGGDKMMFFRAGIFMNVASYVLLLIFMAFI